MYRTLIPFSTLTKFKNKTLVILQQGKGNSNNSTRNHTAILHNICGLNEFSNIK